MLLSKHKAGHSKHPLHTDRIYRLEVIEIVRGHQEGSISVDSAMQNLSFLSFKI
jgi:hypothetical protein